MSLDVLEDVIYEWINSVQQMADDARSSATAVSYLKNRRALLSVMASAMFSIVTHIQHLKELNPLWHWAGYSSHPLTNYCFIYLINLYLPWDSSHLFYLIALLTIYIYIYGDFYKPRKARFIPTFCKRINRSREMGDSFWRKETSDFLFNRIFIQQTINRVLHQMEQTTNM